MTEQARQEHYTSPFSARYISPEMSALFSEKWRATTFRKLWVALAKAQKKLGLSITSEQVTQLEEHLETIDFEAIERYEKKLRHDVMAHIHAYGDQCPLAKPIIHLGATSSYVTDNADLIQLKEALQKLLQKLLHLLHLLAKKAEQEADTPCLSYTHFQSAQPTTIGKRICLWLQDFLLDAKEWEEQIRSLPFFGVKGATGTQASFLSLFEGNEEKVLTLESLIAHQFGFSKVLKIAGQTYPRKIDTFLLNALSSFAASAHKMATDIRLLAHEQEMLESFAEHQVGSSAMPYKRNPIYAERICGIARFVMSLAQNPTYTLATQWLERSLDDSSNRRLTLSQAFLGADALLNLLIHLTSNLEIRTEEAMKHIQEELPYLVMENILMQAVKKGGSRQALHETLRQIALQARHQPNPLLYLKQAIRKDSAFGLRESEIDALCDPKELIGRAPSQVKAFLEEEVEPLLKKQSTSSISIPSIEI